MSAHIWWESMCKKPARDFGNILEDMLPWYKKEHDEEGAKKKKLQITELEDV